MYFSTHFIFHSFKAMKNRIFGLGFILLSLTSFAQEDFLVFENVGTNDTVKCTITTIERKNGPVIKIKYLDSKNVSHSIEGEKNCTMVKSLMIDGLILEYVPVFFNKAKGLEKGHLKKVIDGPISVYRYIVLTAKLDKNGERKISFDSNAPNASVVQLGLNGEFVSAITSKSIKKVIFPYLEKCPEFKKQFTGYKNNEYLAFACATYNKYCRD